MTMSAAQLSDISRMEHSIVASASAAIVDGGTTVSGVGVTPTPTMPLPPDQDLSGWYSMLMLGAETPVLNYLTIINDLDVEGQLLLDGELTIGEPPESTITITPGPTPTSPIIISASAVLEIQAPTTQIISPGAPALQVIGGPSPAGPIVTITQAGVTEPAGLTSVDVELEVQSQDGHGTRIMIDAIAANPALGFRRAQGTSAAPATATNGTVLGALNYYSFDGTAWGASQSGSMNCIADGDWTPTSHGTSFNWQVTPQNATVTGVAMTLTGEGNLLIGTTVDNGQRLLITSGALGTALAQIRLVGQSGQGWVGIVGNTQDPVANPLFLTAQRNGNARWTIQTGDGTESGTNNTGSDFSWIRFNDAGSAIETALKLVRGTGNLLVGPTSDNGARLQVVGGPSPGPPLGYVNILESGVVSPPGLSVGDLMLRTQAADGKAGFIEADSFGPNCGFRVRVAQGTAAAPQASNGGIGILQFAGYDGTNWTGGQTTMNAVVEGGPWTSTNHGARMQWQTTPIGTTGTAAVMALTAGGNLVIATPAGGPDPGSRLNVVGAAGTTLSVASIVQNGVTEPAGLSAFDNITLLRLQGVDSGTTVLAIDGISNPGIGARSLTFRGAFGSSAAPTPMNNAAGIGQIGFVSWDGAAWSTGGGTIAGIIEGGPWTPTSHGMRYILSTVPPGSTSPVNAMLITGNGRVQIGPTVATGPDQGHQLVVGGDAKVNAGFSAWGAVPPTTQPTISGSLGSATVSVLTQLVTALAATGLIVNGTSA